MDYSGLHFNEIYDQCSDNVFRYIYYMVHDSYIAEDLTQDTFIKVYRNLHTFKFKSSINTWIFTIARNVTLDYLKRKKLVAFFDSHFDEKLIKTYQKSSIEILLNSEEIKAFYSALFSLKREYREVLVLRKINECSVKETASILNWSEDKVKSMTSRAMIKLKEELIKKGEKFNE